MAAMAFRQHITALFTDLCKVTMAQAGSRRAPIRPRFQSSSAGCSRFIARVTRAGGRIMRTCPKAVAVSSDGSTQAHRPEVNRSGTSGRLASTIAPAGCGRSGRKSLFSAADTYADVTADNPRSRPMHRFSRDCCTSSHLPRWTRPWISFPAKSGSCYNPSRHPDRPCDNEFNAKLTQCRVRAPSSVVSSVIIELRWSIR